MEARTVGRAVITGATGMIGSALCRLLLREGAEVYALVRPGSRKLSNLPDDPHLTVIPCALSGLDALPEIRADAWYHFGWDGVYGPARQDEALQKSNVEALKTALKQAASCGAHSFLLAGSQAEYGLFSGVLTEDTPMHPQNWYGKEKLLAEKAGNELSDELGIRFITARILSVYGPGDNDYTMVMTALRTFLRGGRASFTAGEQIWDYLYADDAAEAFLRLSERGRGGEAYVLGSGQSRPLREYILEIRDAVDPELPAGLGDLAYPPGQVMHLEADISKLVQDTGFVPRTDFREGIRKTLEWVREREGI